MQDVQTQLVDHQGEIDDLRRVTKHLQAQITHLEKTMKEYLDLHSDHLVKLMDKSG